MNRRETAPSMTILKKSLNEFRCSHISTNDIERPRRPIEIGYLTLLKISRNRVGRSENKSRHEHESLNWDSSHGILRYSGRIS